MAFLCFFLLQRDGDEAHRRGHDNGAHHAGAQVALLARRDEIGHDWKKEKEKKERRKRDRKR